MLVQRDEPVEITGRRIALLSIAIGVLLSLAKVFIGWAAHSTAVVSDGVEAAADVLSSAIVYAGFSIASKPPDKEHPYGHGRYETLSGLGVGGLLFVTGALILVHSFATLNDRAAVRQWALYPLAGAAVIKCALAFYKFRTSRKIGSPSLEADAWHDLTDLLSTAIASGAVLLNIHDPLRFAIADHIGGMIIGAIILFLSMQVVRRTVDSLVDTMPEPPLMAQIRDSALRVPGALGIEKCFARRTGLRYHVDLHLEVNPDLTVRESHAIARDVRNSIKGSLDWVADVLIHVEPSPEARVVSKVNLPH